MFDSVSRIFPANNTSVILAVLYVIIRGVPVFSDFTTETITPGKLRFYGLA